MKLAELFDCEKVFFTSDTHFSHENIITYCKRPFASVEEMNEHLITNWNKVIPKDGIVFHLGDVAMGNYKNTKEPVLARLNGTIHLIVGNHDRKDMRSNKRFKSVSDILEIQVMDTELEYGMQHVIMCHYPMIVWPASHRGSWQLFGHVHGNLSNKGTINHKPTQLDVGVDCNNYSPFTWQDIKTQMTLNGLNAMKK